MGEANDPVVPLRVAMVGNPNVGKTSLFNRMCGVRAKTANFPGSTVEARVGAAVVGGIELELVDLPGVYAVDLDLPESKLCRDCLAGRLDGCMPDALLVVIDATNLARGLRLFKSVASAARPVAVALTMTDLAQARGLSIDPERLAVALGVPCVASNGRAGSGIEQLAAALRDAREVSPQVLAASLSPGWVDETAASIVGGPNSIGSETDRWTDRLDSAFTHPLLGAIVFISAMALVFFAIFRLAELPMELIEGAASMLGGWVAATMPEGAVSDLLVNGVIGGVAGTVVFLPQICLLFFLLALLEDTGYLARAAFVMDRLMCRFGLPGQAFVPLLSSHACALPGIMSARLIPDPKDRLATILVAPFMSCSARVGVYVLLVSILFPNSPFLAGLAFAGCYALGAIAALLTAVLFRRTILKGKSRPMVLELPPYRLPSLRSALLTTYDRGLVFLKNAGSVILAICILMWWLSAYPKAATPEEALALEARAQTVAAQVESAPDDAAKETLAAEADTLAAEAEVLAARAQQQFSFAGRLGNAVEPVFAPLGLDERLTVAVLTSFLAREVFRSTVTVLVGSGDSDDDTRVADELRGATRADGSPLFDAATSASLLVFFVLAMQCLPTLAVTRRETGSWKWPAVQFAWMSAVAYIAAFATHLLVQSFGGAA
ncbi:MAG: ferrous iron transporter B [Planctomycetota bacterium]|jgi:ferrous iron transport protein B|nr:ferrous iron transporter B [Planctomycetota bacterium]